MAQENRTTEKKASSRRTSRRKPQKRYDHIPIIFFLLIMFGLALLCIGIGLAGFIP